MKKMPMSKEFNGIFKEEFERYIEFKKSQNIYHDIEDKTLYDLLKLCRFLDAYNLEEIKITKEMTDDYIKSSEGLAQATRHKYEGLIRQFALFLKMEGYEDIYIQYGCQIKMPRDYIPYVFSNEETKTIFSIIDSEVGKNLDPQIGVFYRTFFRLLYCTGLRLGEAIDLKIEDVDLQSNILTVRHSKGNTSRIVPFKDSLHDWLEEYDSNYRRSSDIYFFEAVKGGKRCRRVIYSAFKRVLEKSSIRIAPVNGYSRGPCIHSLRHTFACNALDQMIREGKDPYCALPYLSVYLGHADVTNTEYYLRLTLEHHEEITQAGSAMYEKIFKGGTNGN